MSAADPDYRRAAAYLSRVAEPGSLPLFELAHRVGYEQAAELIRAGAVGDDLRAATEARAATADPDADLDAAAAAGIRLVTPIDAEWPYFAFSALYHASEDALGRRAASRGRAAAAAELLPPIALWARGRADLAGVSARSVAVVGSRAATAYGQQIAAELCYGLAGHDVTVVSGGAYGIDAAAHRGALAAGGITIAVSAGGLDRPYPAGNAELFQRIVQDGLLVSERPPGSAPQRQRFLSRNRIIAALGGAVLVVEAAVRSGALNTARYGRDLGRPVLGTPGPISSAQSAGVHELLRRGEEPGQLVTCVSEVLEWTPGGAGEGGDLFSGSEVRVGWRTARVASEAASMSSPAAGPGTTRGSWAALDAVSPLARSVYDGFPARRPAGPSEVAGLCGRPIAAVVASLDELCVAGLIEPDGMRYRRRLTSAGGR